MGRTLPGLVVGIAAVILVGGVVAFSVADVGGLSPFDLTVNVGGCPKTIWGTTAVDWAPFVNVGGRTYYEDWDAVIDNAQLGEPVSAVRCQFGDEVRDIRVTPRDGDAAFLPVGTVLFELTGFSPSFRLVADTRDGLRLYEVWPEGEGTARGRFGDLDAIATGISLRDGANGTVQLGYIDDPDTVRGLVADMLDGSFTSYSRSGEGARYFLQIEFGDLPRLTVVFWADEARIHPDLPVSDWFVETILQSVKEA